MTFLKMHMYIFNNGFPPITCIYMMKIFKIENLDFNKQIIQFSYFIYNAYIYSHYSQKSKLLIF